MLGILEHGYWREIRFSPDLELVFAGKTFCSALNIDWKSRKICKNHKTNLKQYFKEHKIFFFEWVWKKF